MDRTEAVNVLNGLVVFSKDAFSTNFDKKLKALSVFSNIKKHLGKDEIEKINKAINDAKKSNRPQILETACREVRTSFADRMKFII